MAWALVPAASILVSRLSSPADLKPTPQVAGCSALTSLFQDRPLAGGMAASTRSGVGLPRSANAIRPLRSIA